MKKFRYVLPILVITLAPSTALANAGTPLMWGSMLHLAFGNALLGIIEGSLLSWIFKSPKGLSIMILIFANYASAWAGGFMIYGGEAFLPDITIQNLQAWFLVLVAVAFLVTLVIEFPFFWLALRSDERPLRQALKATPVIHGISYALLFGWYWMISGTSMITDLRAVPPGTMTTEDNYVLYYLTTEGDRIMQLELDGRSDPMVMSAVSAPHESDRLFVRPGSQSGYDLHVFLDADRVDNEKELLISESFAEQAPVDWLIAEGHSDKASGTWASFGPVASLADDSDWEYQTGFWPVEGIYGRNTRRKYSVHFSLETPFIAWAARNATHIAGDYVIFQLGKDQICMLHPETNRITLLARGKGPIVAIPQTPGKPGTANND